MSTFKNIKSANGVASSVTTGSSLKPISKKAKLEQQMDALAIKMAIAEDKLETNISNTKETSDLVKVGFTVLVLTAGASVIAVIGIAIGTGVSLYTLYKDSSPKIEVPENWCAVINNKQ